MANALKIAVAVLAFSGIAATTVHAADSVLSTVKHQLVQVKQEGNGKQLWESYLQDMVKLNDLNNSQLKQVLNYLATDDFLTAVHHYTKEQLHKIAPMVVKAKAIKA